MAAGDVARVIRAPGRLIVNPLDEFDGGSYPYGGTEVGKANLCALVPLGTQFRVESEGLGEATDVLEGGQRWVFSCFVRGWDDDAVRLLMPDGHEAGESSQHAVFAVPGVQVPGSSAMSRALVVAFVPDDLLHSPGVILYRAIPDWSDGAELAFRRGSELGLPISFECLRDDDDRILKVGRLVDLPL